MKKIYLFSENVKSILYKDLSFLTERLEIIPFRGLSADEALKLISERIEND